MIHTEFGGSNAEYFGAVVVVFDVFAAIGSSNKTAGLFVGAGFIEVLWWVGGVYGRLVGLRVKKKGY